MEASLDYLALNREQEHVADKLMTYFSKRHHKELDKMGFEPMKRVPRRNISCGSKRRE